MNAYGPRQVPATPYGSAKVRKITPSFVCRALNNDNIEIYGDGTQISDMIYVVDVAKALINAMEFAIRGELVPTVEIGPKINNTVNEVAELIIDLSDSKSKIVHLPMRPGEIPNAVVSADCDTLRYIDMHSNHLIDIEEGMINTINYYKEYLKS